MRTETIVLSIGIAIVLMGVFAAPSAAEKPVNVCILVSPDTIMLDSNSPIFGIETEVYENISVGEIIGLTDGFPTEEDIAELFPEAYDVSDMYYSEDIVLGVVVDEKYEIFDGVDENKSPVIGEVIIDVETRKDYELSPHTGRFVMLYERGEVLSTQIGFDAEGNVVTVGDLLDFSCGDGTTGRVPFFIRGTFNTGDHTGEQFYGYNYADVMHKSQTTSNGNGKNR